MNSAPVISVIIPTYNGSRFIEETLQSVIEQTYRNLEIIIVDDCSSDNTVEIIKSFNDDRIKLFVNEQNLGIAENTNKALSFATGKYIMMQDHDDISSPVRAEMIVKFLEVHPDVTGCGSRIHKMIKAGDPFTDDSEVRVSMDVEELSVTILFDRLINHPTILYRRSILESVDKAYSGEFKFVSDDDFFHRLNLAGAKWCFLDNQYLKYRVHQNSTSKRYRKLRYPESLEIARRTFKSMLPFATDEDISLHALVQSFGEPVSFFGKYNDWCIDWYKRIIDYNLKTKRFNHDKLLKTMARYWHCFATISNAAAPFKAFKVYRSIDEINPYLMNNYQFFKQWQVRFFRCFKWKFIRNKNF